MMKNDQLPRKILLMTGTIKPFVKVKHNDPQVRLKEYVQTISRYITDSDFDTILFAENSGYQFDSSELEAQAEACGKKLLILRLVDGGGNNMSSGEAILMRRALEACPFIEDTDVIWKVTGRLWISNINRLLARHTRNTNVFLYARKYDSMQTWFFCAKVDDLKKYFLTDEAIEAMKQSCIEYVWMDCYRANKQIRVERFAAYPNVIGNNSSGNAYTLSPIKRRMFDLLLLMGRFSVRRSDPAINRTGL